MRLLAGMLAGQAFGSTLDGSAQLRRRPMRRVVEPLSLMGACIASSDGHAPLTISGRPIHGIEYRLQVASAQVKSAMLLAGLFAEGATVIREPGPSRDHTERMLRAMGANISSSEGTVTIRPPAEGETSDPLLPVQIVLPGDFSSAAFLIVAGLLVQGSKLEVRNVGVNATRTGLLEVLAAMGATVDVQNEHVESGEPVADVFIQSAGNGLRGTAIAGQLVVRTIDELPILAVAATQAEGVTQVRDAGELRVKEVDRVACLAEELRKLGAKIEDLPDGFAIEGPVPLRGAVVDSHGDHRLAMALAVAGLVAYGETTVLDAGTASDSFPGFWETLAGLGATRG